ncbi:MAG: signal peptidase I [Planctomycetota bacterium]|nr:MAG: signal peptidase I [Planctomycetota bacterium]
MEDNHSVLSKELPKKQSSWKRKVLKWGASFSLAFFIVFLIKWFCIEPFLVVGKSMEPTLHTGEVVLVNKISPWFQDFHRGEIIVFPYPKNPRQKLIKRIVGLENEEIEIQNGVVRINGKAYSEPYALPPLSPRHIGPLLVPKGCFFVLGDNRNCSLDSRKGWVVLKNNIIGKASYVLIPHFHKIK